MSDFWNKKPAFNPQLLPEQPIVLDEEAMATLQEGPNVNIFDEEEEDLVGLMSDANLRLEQGRLYQMILENDIFADTNANPKAIRSVQREIRKFVRERLEVMLGIKQEQTIQQTIVSSPFNDLEVTVLKMLASKMSKGATEQPQEITTVQAPPTPKKDGISSISGTLRPQAPVKLTPTSQATQKPVTKPTVASAKPQPKSTVNKPIEGSALKKPIEQMTQEELIAYNAEAEKRSISNKAALPNNLIPHPTPEALQMMYMNTERGLNYSAMRPYR